MKIVSIIGLPGSGKTTLCHQIVNSGAFLGNFLLAENPLTKSELSALKYLDMQRTASGIWDHDAYQAQFLKIAVRRSWLVIQAAQKSSVVLLDRPIEDPICITDILYRQGKLRRYDELRERYYAKLRRVQTDIGIYLQVAPHIAKLRLDARGDGYHSRDDYFELCSNHYQHWFQEKINSFKVFEVNQITPEALLKSVLSYLDSAQPCIPDSSKNA